MGLFDRLFSSQQTAKPAIQTIPIPNEEEAFIAILFCCLQSDGEASDEEIDAFVRYVLTRPAFMGMPITDIYRKYFHYMRQFGSINPIVQAAMPMIREDRKPQLFATAVDFVLADGVVQQSEQQLLEDLQAGLGLDAGLAEKIIEVLLIKNQTVL